MSILNPLCYLCGRENPDSRDHVPARALFYPRLPDDLMTAPAHRSCQGAYAQNEAYFAQILDSARLGGGTRWLHRWRQLSVPPARTRTPQRVEIDCMSVVLKKIIQGLVFYHSGSLFVDGDMIRIQPSLWEGYFLTKSGQPSKRPPPVFLSRGNHGEFKYAFRVSSYTSTTWHLLFYERFMFQCEVIWDFAPDRPVVIKENA
jgi:hypothetical protein